jgi:hypothetical protein
MYAVMQSLMQTCSYVYACNHAGRYTCRKAVMQVGSHAGKQTCRQAVMQVGSHSGKQTCRQAAMLVGSHAGRLQTVMKAYKLAHTHTGRHTGSQTGR